MATFSAPSANQVLALLKAAERLREVQPLAA